MKKAAVYLMGGLGNQLFQYLFGLGIRERRVGDIIFMVDWFQNNQFQERILDRPLQLSKLFNSAIVPFTTLGIQAESGILFTSVVRPEEQESPLDLWSPISENTLYIGYYQDDYLMPTDTEIDVCFDQIRRSDSIGISADSLHDVVGVHVRLGDYLRYPDLFPVLPVKYYEAALESFPIARRYLVFSESVNEAQQYLAPLSSKYNLEFLAPSAPWIDFILLSSMPAIIGANSTFSLLAGWVARTRGAKVVIPRASSWHGPTEATLRESKGRLILRSKIEQI